MKKLIAFAACAMMAIALLGCSSDGAEQQSEPQEPPAPLDLTGTWEATNSASEDSGMEAIIEGGTITVNWVNEADSTKALYWAGSYVAPTEATDTYSWDSENDTEQTSTALLAASGDTKTFSYQDGVLSFDVTAMGVTKTITMERVG